MNVLRVPSLFLALALAGCPAVFPELGTRTRTIPAGQPLDPPPPAELRWIHFVSARVPDHTRDGRTWQADGKASPYAKLLVNGVELFRTNVQSDTLTPTWPGSTRGNFRVAPTDHLRVELWDANPLNDKPIGLRDLGAASDLKDFDGQVHVAFEEGLSDLLLAFEPAHAVSGLGLWYELRTVGCAITRLLEGSPAERAGILPGDEVVKIGAREASTMTPDEIRSAFNAVPLDGLALVVKHPTGAVTGVLLKEGPIYPTFAQFGPIE
jgi:membrane-associated protease RseP (regulator of RpoE activity)